MREWVCEGGGRTSGEGLGGQVGGWVERVFCGVMWVGWEGLL